MRVNNAKQNEKKVLDQPRTNWMVIKQKSAVRQFLGNDRLRDGSMMTTQMGKIDKSRPMSSININDNDEKASSLR